MEERKEAYDAMTTEKVGVAVVALGLFCLVVMTYLLAELLLSQAGAPRMAIGAGSIDISGIAAVPALLVIFPYFQNAYFRAVVLGIAPLGALIGFTLGTILGGLATPTEAASCGAFGATLLALVYGRLNLKAANNAGHRHHDDLGHGAVPGRRVERVRRRLHQARHGQRDHRAPDRRSAARLVEAGAHHVLVFMLGWPFEWPAIILVFLPIVLPVVEKLQLGLSKLDLLIWFGALMAVNLQTAFLSPPVAMSAYYLRNVVPQWRLSTIYRGMADYMVIQVIVLALLLLYPQIALWLPHATR